MTEFSESDMIRQAYSRGVKENEVLQDRNEKLREALQAFVDAYPDDYCYIPCGDPDCLVCSARKALG